MVLQFDPNQLAGFWQLIIYFTLLKINMQEQRQSGNRQVSRQSFTMRLSSNRSIDRYSQRRSDRSLDRPPSLYEALDVQDYTRRSHQNHDSLLFSQNYNQYYRRSGASRNQNFENTLMQQEIPINQRSSSNRNIHQCSCQKQCNEEHCTCFFYPNELCIIGLCCPNCIKKKNQYLMMTDCSSRTACFCKSSKCLKMYCLCFREGKKCNINLCKCDGCQNMAEGQNNKNPQKNKEKTQKERKNKNTTASTINSNRQNNHLKRNQKAKIQDSNYDFVFCSCKKSHCLKKYCPCYSVNKQCNECCICQDCQNKSDQDESRSEKKRRYQRFARRDSSGSKGSQKEAILIQKKPPIINILSNKMEEKMQEEDIDQFFQQNQDYTKMQMNKDMQFEPVNFGTYHN